MSKLYNKVKKIIKRRQFDRRVNKLFDGAIENERRKKKRR